MAATKKLKETGHVPEWKFIAEKGGDWKVESRFGCVETAVVVDENGKSVFDRPAYREAPNVNCIAYGVGSDGKTRVAIIRQPRPHADDPEQPGNNHQPIVFGQIPMGFLRKIAGEDIELDFESVEAGAVREVAEETGASAVITMERPKYPWHNPNPTFVATWSNLVFLRVDLDKVQQHRSTRNETIYTAEYISIKELMRRTAQGKDEQGAAYRMCTSNSLWWIFFCTHPELLREAL